MLFLLGLSPKLCMFPNFLISGLQKYDEHPIIRFYNKHLVNDRDKLDACAQLSVSINTDDKGIFSTSLENEYALIACALEQCKDEEDNYLYDKTSVYEWVEQIRKFGNMQSFGDSPNYLPIILFLRALPA